MRELTTQELDLVAGGLFLGSDYTHVSISSKIYVAAKVYGNSALAEADAYGYNTFTDVQTVTTPYSSQSSAVSVSS